MYRSNLKKSFERSEVYEAGENDCPSQGNVTVKCQVAQERDLLLSKLSLIGEMSSCIAHGVRNPMTTVRGMAQLLAMEYPENSGYYELMIEEIDQADEMLKEFLCLAKNSNLTRTKVMLNHVLRRSVDLIYRQAIEHNLHICTSLSDDACLLADEEKLMQVFMHILKNAIEASPKGSNVFVLSRCGEKYAKVRIVDEGMGIDGSLLERIIDPFFTTKESNPGLGLSVAYKIVEDHSGKLKIDSSPGNGTIVEVTLPLLVAKMDAELA